MISVTPICAHAEVALHALTVGSTLQSSKREGGVSKDHGLQGRHGCKGGTKGHWRARQDWHAGCWNRSAKQQRCHRGCRPRWTLSKRSKQCRLLANLHAEARRRASTAQVMSSGQPATHLCNGCEGFQNCPSFRIRRSSVGRACVTRECCVAAARLCVRAVRPPPRRSTYEGGARWPRSEGVCNLSSYTDRTK